MSPAQDCCSVSLPAGGGRRLLGQEAPLGRKHGENNGSLTRPGGFGVSVFFTGATHLPGLSRPVLKMLKIHERVGSVFPAVPAVDLLSSSCPGAIRRVWGKTLHK